MTENAYTRAVESFEALIEAPTTERLNTPAALIKAAGLPASSGYRHVATLQAEGFLRRDENGTYLPGPTTIRTGFRAEGVGRLAPASHPVLLQLRQATQATAFLAFSQDMTLKIGPHSVGRNTRQVTLQPSYDFENVPDFAPGAISDITLRTVQDGIARRIRVLLSPLEITSDAILHLGLLASSRRENHDALGQLLARASAQLQAAALDVQ